MKGYLATLLLALPFVVAMVPAVAHSTRNIEIALSRDAFAPRQIEVQLGDRVRLVLTSTDGAHGLQVNELGLNSPTPAGKTMILDLTPTDPGTYEIQCSDDCDSGARHVRAQLIVTPAQ